MLSVFHSFRDVTLASMTLRMVLAVVCGGVIGMEREYKRRPAGFRTHILICLGAAITTLTSQFMLVYMHYNTDVARLGAQVVAGMGFIGAGCIIVTRRQRIKGLTTAAGLWASAIVGLALGAGFYEGGIFTTVLLLMAELFFSKYEYRLRESAPEINLYMEYKDRATLEEVLRIYREIEVKILSMEITRAQGSDNHNACAIFTLRLNRRWKKEQVIAKINFLDGVLALEEL